MRFYLKSKSNEEIPWKIEGTSQILEAFKSDVIFLNDDMTLKNEEVFNSNIFCIFYAIAPTLNWFQRLFFY